MPASRWEPFILGFSNRLYQFEMSVWPYIYLGARIALVAAFVIGAASGLVLYVIDPKTAAVKKIVTWVLVRTAAICILSAVIIVPWGPAIATSICVLAAGIIAAGPIVTEGQ
jgi:hypothetical protein